MLFVALIVATAILTILTLLPISRHEAWWIRSLDFPRLQLSVILLILIILEILLLDLSHPLTWVLLAIGSGCLIYQAFWIFPYTPLFPVEVKPASKAAGQQAIRIMAANVLTPNRNAKGLIQLIRENMPDILVTLESDAWWQKKLDILKPDYPYAIKCPLDNLYGMHVYSKFQLLDCHIQYLVEPDKPSIHTHIYLPSGNLIRAHFLHPAPPSPTENKESSERDAELIIVARHVTEKNSPTIVAGDLNDVAWSETTRLFRKTSGLLDPRVGRGMFNTFHANYWFLRYPLDHLFHSDHFTLSKIKRLPGFGSDHFPLFCELVYENGRKLEQNGLDADSDDLFRAQAKIDDEGVSKKIFQFNDFPEI
jgi:endonuclease/exonuclease/phosphatase (EEP) superfamily protein YafD